MDKDFRNILNQYSNYIFESSGRGQPRELKITNTMGPISAALRCGYKMINSHSIVDGTVALLRDQNGDAYEVQVRPSYSGDYFQKERGLMEAEYDGMVHFEEVVSFLRDANPSQIREFNSLVSDDLKDEALELMKFVNRKSIKESLIRHDLPMGLEMMESEHYYLLGGYRSGSPSSDGHTRLKYDIIPKELYKNDVPKSKFTAGNVELYVDGHRSVRGLVNIEIFPRFRGKYVSGSTIVREILDLSPDGLEIYDIKPKAIGFWEKMGIEFTLGKREGFIPK